MNVSGGSSSREYSLSQLKRRQESVGLKKSMEALGSKSTGYGRREEEEKGTKIGHFIP